MQHEFYHLHGKTLGWHHIAMELLLAVFLVAFIIVSPVSASMRLQERSLYMQSSEPGATTSYTVSFRYMSPQPIGSVTMLFCMDPIPYHPCVTPPGMNVAGAELTDQTGETGFSIATRTTNRLVLSRPTTPITDNTSSYTFSNIRNPTDSQQAFAIRLQTLESSTGAGSQVDFGSVRGQVTEGIVLETQVPPMLIFCVAEQVEEHCAETNDNYYTDMGQLSHASTLTAQSQMAVGTNASGGFAITAVGAPMSAGTSIITPLATPTTSQQGNNQFGINLVENTSPAVGSNPVGDWANAVASTDYSMPDRYKFVSGDVVAYSPNVSLMRKFTVSYVVNSHENLRAGVYSTTITYIASGRF